MLTVYDLYEVKSNIRIFASIDKGTKWRHDLDVAILSILRTFVTPTWHYNAKSVILSISLQLRRSLESLLIVTSGCWVCYSVILLNFWRRSQKTPNCKLWCQFFKFVNLTNIFRAPYEYCFLLALQTENDEKWKFPNRSFFQQDSFRAILAFWWPFVELHEHTPSIRKFK